MARRAFLMAFGLFAATSAHAQSADATKLLADGRAAYYSLSRLGFGGAVCKVTPDWPLTLGKPRNDPDSQAGFQILESLRFTLKVDKAGAATVDKVDPGAPRPAGVAQGVSQIFSGMDQTFQGFFATWDLFMLNSPLPDPGVKATVTTRPGGYRITYKEGDSDVATDMAANLEISRLDVRAPDFHSVIAPKFRRTPQGLVLATYVGDYTPDSGPGVTHIEVALDYQTVSGLQVPRTLTVHSTVDGQRSNVAFEMTDCRVTKGS